jgi:hypothetical protein
MANSSFSVFHPQSHRDLRSAPAGARRGEASSPERGSLGRSLGSHEEGHDREGLRSGRPQHRERMRLVESGGALKGLEQERCD